ncbi:MAG: DUF2807 domain-containing protein [bacterium]
MNALTYSPLRRSGWRTFSLLATAAAFALEAAGQNRSVTINTAPIVQIGGGHAHVGGIHVDGNDGIRGSGKEVKEERKVGTFATLHLSVTARIEINVGRPTRLTLSGDDNILPLILTEVRDRTLIVRSKESYTSQRELVLILDTPSLSAVRMEGAGNLAIRGLRGTTFSLHTSGACDVVAGGTVEELDLIVEGSGDADLKNLTSTSARIKVTGAANCSARVRHAVEAIVSGVGEIRLYGKPAKVQKNISGVGEVILVDDEETAPDVAIPQARGVTNISVPLGGGVIVSGDSASYGGTVKAQGSSQASVVNADGTWEGTVRVSNTGETAQYFDKDGDMRAVLRPTGKDTIGVFSPSGSLDTILIERTAPGTTEEIEADPPPEKSLKSDRKRPTR